jgi:hypothetical protein
MTCEKYREALIEAAATNGRLGCRIDHHVEHCAKCRATLHRERLLFVAIDDALRARMNQKPHPGFLPGVRARIAEQRPPESRWVPAWAWATAVLALALIAMVGLWARPRRRLAEIESLKTQAIRAPKKSQFLPLGRGSTEDSNPHLRVRQVRTTKRALAWQAAHREPEVLVPPEEGRAFAQFVARLGQRDEVAQAFVSPAADHSDEPFQISPVEIARVQLKPLAWE